jgi:hypothetical protein
VSNNCVVFGCGHCSNKNDSTRPPSPVSTIPHILPPQHSSSMLMLTQPYAQPLLTDLYPTASLNGSYWMQEVNSRICSFESAKSWHQPSCRQPQTTRHHQCKHFHHYLNRSASWAQTYKHFTNGT